MDAKVLAALVEMRHADDPRRGGPAETVVEGLLGLIAEVDGDSLIYTETLYSLVREAYLGVDEET